MKIRKKPNSIKAIKIKYTDMSAVSFGKIIINNVIEQENNDAIIPIIIHSKIKDLGFRTEKLSSLMLLSE